MESGVRRQDAASFLASEGESSRFGRGEEEVWGLALKPDACLLRFWQELVGVNHGCYGDFAFRCAIFDSYYAAFALHADTLG